MALKIPVFDFLTPNHDLLQHALSRVGFVYLRNSALTKDVISRTLNRSREFFQLPRVVKDRCTGFAQETGRRGYYLYTSDSRAWDHIECFSFGNNSKNPASLRMSYFNHVGMPEDMWLDNASHKNNFPRNKTDPDWDSDFQRTILSYWEACSETTVSLLRELEISLGIPSQTLQAGHNKHDHTLELKFYPSPPEDSELTVERLASHADLSTVTLLTQDAVQGLEVWDDVDKEWVTASLTENDVLANTGDLLEFWTGGRVISTKHRVRTTRGGGRHSIVFFATPNFETDISPCGWSGARVLCGDKMPFL